MDVDSGPTPTLSEAQALLREWLRRQNLTDPAHPEFALTPRTGRLRVRGTEGEPDPQLRPLVTAFAVAAPPWPKLWAASDDAVFSWLADKARRYEPFADAPMFAGEPKAMHNGVLMSEPDYRQGCYARQYFAIERTGVIELGLGGHVCIADGGSEKAFLLTPIVAHVWHLFGLAGDLYSHFGQTRPFTLVVTMRETQDALIGGLANGWRQPWGQTGYKVACSEVGVQLRTTASGPCLMPMPREGWRPRWPSR
jgi:hypothetical protein